MVFDDKINYKYCYDNCMYNCRDIKQVLVFEAYNMTANLDMMYKDIAKYFDLLFFSEH